MTQGDFQDKAMAELSAIRVSLGQLTIAQASHEKVDDRRFGSIAAWTKGLAFLVIAAALAHLGIR